MLEDPRGGGRPPFHQRRFVAPSVGKMVMFPGWLQHHVTPTQYSGADDGSDDGWETEIGASAGTQARARGGDVERVSFSFNIPGDWDTSSDINLNIAV